MKIEKTKIQGCHIVEPTFILDDRGSFVKIYNKEIYSSLGFRFDLSEEYYSYSKKNVLRGLHFQIPPADHDKLVYCVYGEILDVAVDIRNGSPTYGEHFKDVLSSENRKAVYLTKGIAHGYYVLSDFAIVIYNTTSGYSADHDSGILWNSVSVNWPSPNPILSKRDSNFLHFDQFITPFRFGE
jgi:dTDP-4-dehydrorhamnose 3,5-epimerase